MALRVWSWWILSGSRWPVVAWLMAVVLQWKEPEADDGGASTTTPSIKLAGHSLDMGGVAMFLSPPSHYSGAKEENMLSLGIPWRGDLELMFFLARIR
jgi:hypothetical protein